MRFNTAERQNKARLVLENVDVWGTVECDISPLPAEYAEKLERCFGEDPILCDFTVEPYIYGEKFSRIVLHFNFPPGEASDIFAELEENVNALLQRFTARMHS